MWSLVVGLYFFIILEAALVCVKVKEGTKQIADLISAIIFKIHFSTSKFIKTI